jgi:hypothetical protein
MVAAKLARTLAVKAIDSQRWICRIQLLQFKWTSSAELHVLPSAPAVRERAASRCPCPCSRPRLRPESRMLHPHQRTVVLRRCRPMTTERRNQSCGELGQRPSASSSPWATQCPRMPASRQRGLSFLETLARHRRNKEHARHEKFNGLFSGTLLLAGAPPCHL